MSLCLSPPLHVQVIDDAVDASSATIVVMDEQVRGTLRISFPPLDTYRVPPLLAPVCCRPISFGAVGLCMRCGAPWWGRAPRLCSSPAQEVRGGGRGERAAAVLVLLEDILGQTEI